MAALVVIVKAAKTFKTTNLPNIYLIFRGFVLAKPPSLDTTYAQQPPSTSKLVRTLKIFILLQTMSYAHSPTQPLINLNPSSFTDLYNLISQV